jgi:hypothetical protein
LPKPLTKFTTSTTRTIIDTPPAKARAAATQGTFPLIAIVLLVIGLAM